MRTILLPRARATYVPPSEPWPDDPEDLVHDVRVASRRLVEALELAGPLLPEKTAQRLKKDAKQLRRALGARREADVMHKDLRRLARDAELPEEVVNPVGDVLGVSGGDSLRAVRARYTHERLMKARQRVAKACASPTRSANWREVGGPHLYARASQPEARLPHLDRPEEAGEHHALRVELKRLRYAVEILSEVFPDELSPDEVLPPLKRLQDALGTLQDATDLIRFLERDDVRGAVTRAESNGDGYARLREAALEQRGRRHARAVEVAADTAPDLLGRLRRAAGKIGQLERA